MVKRRTAIIRDSIQLVRQEIGLLEKEEIEITAIIEQGHSAEQLDKAIQQLAKTSKRLQLAQHQLTKTLDSLANPASIREMQERNQTITTLFIDNKKFLLNAQQLIQLRMSITTAIQTFRKAIDTNFWGKPKGSFVYAMQQQHADKEKHVAQHMLSLIEHTKKALLYLRNELVQLEAWLEHKKELGENIDVFDAAALQKARVQPQPFSMYYHATNNPSLFTSQPIQLATRDFFMAKRGQDAKEHATGFSGSNLASLHLVQLHIPKKLEAQYIRSYTVDSNVDAEKECFYIAGKHIKAINGYIREGQIRMHLV